jgi:formylglycine-generating enzyme required for sulfatase activity
MTTNMNTLINALLIFLSTLFIPPAQAELPKRVQIDKHIKIISEAQKQNDCGKVIKKMELLVQLTKNIPNNFFYYQGTCLYQQRQYSKAMLHLETYFTNTTSKDKYYHQALDIYMRAEEKQAATLAKQKKQKSNTATTLAYANKLQQIKIQTGIDFIAVESGCFLMGSPTTELERVDDERQHKVCLTKPYLLGKYEITQGQWEAIMGNNPSHFEKCGSRCPIESMSREDIQIFIQKLDEKTGFKFRLPTEAEWEYAARAGTKTAFSFGENINTSQVNYDGDHPYKGKVIGRDRKTPVAVGSLPANSWGFHEMHGNVWELIQDWHNINYYKNSPLNDPKGPAKGTFIIRRGGSWRFGARFCRSAYRGRFRPDSSSHLLGFRLAMTI